jgi:hypothetical protein
LNNKNVSSLFYLKKQKTEVEKPIVVDYNAPFTMKVTYDLSAAKFVVVFGDVAVDYRLPSDLQQITFEAVELSGSVDIFFTGFLPPGETCFFVPSDDL